MSDALQRRVTLYRGNVQGVGFRYRTHGIALRYAVAGYVKNLADGRVEVVAEGTPAELDAFLSDVAAQMADHIRDIRQTTLAPSGEYGSFEIRH